MFGINAILMLFIVFGTVFMIGSEFKYDNGISSKEIESYFQQFIQSFPIVKFSGFFNKSDSAKRGLHISDCSLTTCKVYYNDYISFKGSHIPIPECKSPIPLEIIDSTSARIGDAKLSIRGNTLSIDGKITFECNPTIIAQNISNSQANLDIEYNNESYKNDIGFSPKDSNLESNVGIRNNFLEYQITIKDSTFKANSPYPVNLDCIHRKDFSSMLICANPYLSNAYSFGQFFIYLAAQKPQSFHVPQDVYLHYKVMQDKITQCRFQARSSYCIALAIEEFEKQTMQNLIFDSSWFNNN
ncbi:hypothetical protein LS73_004235 [Helicobacter muridarum]|uniref:Uncharacterized protein n=1 Tax=Helicobacter muridarum TaxID=216 RepID=A0A099TXE5_9HELI|nr:hypothetical protein [Helicobacter muridarum]TLE00624.1 hypothetical protein LS73_004235 [Helicobacter muridarum]STQ85641.1 Uncharacterised protein [Helicobacter muridarum]